MDQPTVGLPEAWDSVRNAVASGAASVPAEEYALARARMADLLCVDDVRAPVTSDPRVAARADWVTSPLFSPSDRVLMELTEQFVLDVSGVTDAQREVIAATFAEAARVWPAVLHAVDMELRVVAVLGGLRQRVPDLAGGVASPLVDALNGVTRQVSLLTALDPLTTELVRLRGARVHDCRMCKALRNDAALAAGGDEDLYRQVDDYESSEDLTEAHQVALRLTDTILFAPTSVPADLAKSLRRHYTDEQVVEIVLDVERNARNKVAVANGTDGEGVGEGLTRYATDTAGRFALVDTGAGVSDPRGRF